MINENAAEYPSNYYQHLEINLPLKYFDDLLENPKSKWGKYKREDSRSPYQRKAANERERKRMHSINKGFDCLRERLPTPPYAKKLSKVETLKNAIDYICQLNNILEQTLQEESNQNPIQNESRKMVRSNVILHDPRSQAFETNDPEFGTCTLHINWRSTRERYSQQFLSQNDEKFASCSAIWIPPQQN
uniref:BHLH domain-containing protein n=1 Tax=Panagrolaimus sp. JU765 TaxID=591449 RepID=A0AC34Q6V1_9BILA